MSWRANSAGIIDYLNTGIIVHEVDELPEQLPENPMMSQCFVYRYAHTLCHTTLLYPTPHYATLSYTTLHCSTLHNSTQYSPINPVNAYPDCSRDR